MRTDKEPKADTEMKECGILFPRDDFRDYTGCLKSDRHDGPHLCETNHGKVEWEFDLECKCGCSETDEINDVCIIYNSK